MLVKNFNVDEDIKLSVAIHKFEPSLEYNAIQKIIRSKDVKVNGVRVSKDSVLQKGDSVQFYFNSPKQNLIDIIYNDNNILIVYKPIQLETVSLENENSLLEILTKQLGYNICAVHRLDRNTDGLVVFAKNLEAKKLLDEAFKNRTIEKYYLTLVYGCFKLSADSLVAYLKKDSKNSVVHISDQKLAGYERIETRYKIVEEYDDCSLVEVELVTGKTHQIRAHFAHIGHFVIGDQKYGDNKINKIFKKKYQCLTAYKIKFHFNKSSILNYLDNKVFELSKEKIKFLSKNK